MGKKNSKRNWPLYSILAACLVLFFSLSSLKKYKSTNNQLLQTEQKWESFLLEDGSVVELDSKSKLEINFNSKSRKTTLISGQALFKVTKNKDKPFIVRAGNNTITVLGTEFTVKKYSDFTVDVKVKEGEVKVETSNSGGSTNKIHLGKKKIYWSSDKNTFIKEQINIAKDYALWKKSLVKQKI